MFNKYISFFFIIFLVSQLHANSKINLLNWWEYTTPQAIVDLRLKGIDLNVMTYKSNEVAISQLINSKDQIHLAVISNAVLPVLRKSGFILPQSFKGDGSSKKYYSFLTEIFPDCLPYMWSTSVFVSNTPQKLKINSFSDFEDQAARYRNIGVIDDKLEVLARIIGDNPQLCSGSGPSYLECNLEKVLNTNIAIMKKNFASSIEELLSIKNSLTYGWHGVAGSLMGKEKNLHFYLPKMKPVIGYDAICVVDNAFTRKNKKMVVSVAKTIAGLQSIHYFVKNQQYFSPIKGDEKFLHPKVSELLHNTLHQVNLNGVLIIKPPEPKAHDLINQWWQKVRYGK